MSHVHSRSYGCLWLITRQYTRFLVLQLPVLNTWFLCVQVSTALTLAGLSNIIDTTGNTIGKRYARTDEIGVPYAVTVDFDSLAESGDSTVTLRERDTMSQVGLGWVQRTSSIRKENIILLWHIMIM